MTPRRVKPAPRGVARQRPASRRVLRRRREARRRRRFAGALLFAAALGAGMAAGPRLASSAAGAFYPDALRVRELAVLGAIRLAPAEVAAAAALPPDARMDTVDSAAMAQRIEAHPWIARARVAGFPPGRLVVSVEEREPAALLIGGDQRFYVDAAGSVFAEVPADEPEPELPRITGAPVDPDPALLAQAVGVARAATAQGVSGPLEVRLGGAPARALPVLVLSELGVEAWLGGASGPELEVRLARLARLLDAELPEVAAAREIDLRFAERTVLRSDASRDATAAGSGGSSAPRNGPAG